MYPRLSWGIHIGVSVTIARAPFQPKHGQQIHIGANVTALRTRFQPKQGEHIRAHFSTAFDLICLYTSVVHYLPGNP